MKLPNIQQLDTMTVATPIPNESIAVEEKKRGSFFGVRHLQCFLLFFGLAIAYALRVNLSVAIVAMTDANSTNPDFSEYTWSEHTKSILLSSFFWGYVLTQVPAGALAKKFGGKVMLLYGVLICSLLNLLTPVCAAIGNWQLVCAVRVVQGLCQGVLFPSTHTILSKWAPVEERGTLGTAAYSGAQFGTVVMFASSGVLASSSMGWPSIFYFSGGVGIIWVAAWFMWGASTPEEYKNITAEEKKLIETSLSQNSSNYEEQKSVRTPWLKFFTSVPFLVLTLSHCAHNWGFWTLITEIPSYMKNILGRDIKSNALLSALPYFAMFVMSFVFSFISSILNKRRCISLSTSRKLFNSIGLWIPACTLIGLAYVGADETNFAIALLTVTVGINASTYLGFQVNHIDLSPNYAGILMGITNCAANVMSIIAPLVVGFIVTDEHNPMQWRIVFFIASGFYFVGNLLFVIFGRTTVQSWNDPQSAIPLQNRDTNHVESQQQ